MGSCHLQAAMGRITSLCLSANKVISSSKHPGHNGSPLNSEKHLFFLPHLSHLSHSPCCLLDFTIMFLAFMFYNSLSVAVPTRYILLLSDYRVLHRVNCAQQLQSVSLHRLQFLKTYVAIQDVSEIFINLRSNRLQFGHRTLASRLPEPELSMPPL